MTSWVAETKSLFMKNHIVYLHIEYILYNFAVQLRTELTTPLVANGSEGSEGS